MPGLAEEANPIMDHWFVLVGYSVSVIMSSLLDWILYRIN